MHGIRACAASFWLGQDVGGAREAALEGEASGDAESCGAHSPRVAPRDLATRADREPKA